MDKLESDSIIYDKRVIEFIAVAVEFCTILEGEDKLSRAGWIDRMLKILPLLYLKASLLPQTMLLLGEDTETFVREEDYARVESSVAGVMQ